VPAYVIFHDATLADMVERHPQTLEQLSHVSGVGERKLEAYGDAFLDVLCEHAQPAVATDTVTETVQLLCRDMTPVEIAQRRDITVATVYNHLARAIEQGEIELEDVIRLDEKTLKAIRFVFEQHSGDKLKPVYEALGGEYDYGVLRCIQVAMFQEAVSVPL
jgi:ATP-dependent DNA helicase RecQ